MAIRGSGGLGSGALSIITLKQYGFFIRYIDRLSGTRSHSLRARSPFQDPLSASGALTLDTTGWVIWLLFSILPDLTIFLFHVLNFFFFFFDIRTVTKPDRAQQSCQTSFISHKWVCNSHQRVSVVTELCYHSNHGTTILRSYLIQTTHPALRASWLTTSTSTTDNVLASPPKGGTDNSRSIQWVKRHSEIRHRPSRRLYGLEETARVNEKKETVRYEERKRDVARLHIPTTKRNQYDTCTLKNLMYPWSP